MNRIDIGYDFSRTPMGRYHPKDGNYTGQLFRERHLVPALMGNDRVIVKIDTTEGYGSSFLEEAFGGLVRNEGFRAEQLRNKLEIECLNPDYRLFVAAIWRYIDKARPNKR